MKNTIEATIWLFTQNSIFPQIMRQVIGVNIKNVNYDMTQADVDAAAALFDKYESKLTPMITDKSVDMFTGEELTLNERLDRYEAATFELNNAKDDFLKFIKYCRFTEPSWWD